MMVSRPFTEHSGRRQSGTASSHRSNLSNVSDYGHADDNDEETRDDSGLGDDIHDHQHANISDRDFQPSHTTYHGGFDRHDAGYRY